MAPGYALLAVAKPIIQLNKRIERLTRLYVGHADNYASLLIIVSRIRRHNDVTPELIESFEAAEARFLELAKEDDPRPNMRLLRRCEATIRQRHPPRLGNHFRASATSVSIKVAAGRSRINDAAWPAQRGRNARLAASLLDRNSARVRLA